MTHPHAPRTTLPRARRDVLLGLAAALLVAGASGCGGPETTEPPPSGGCTDDPRVQQYLVGMQGTSEDGSITLEFLDADPSPPGKGDNVWKIEVTSPSGPVDGATIAVDAFMPDHGHSSTVVPDVTPLGDGVYVLDPIDLFMPGVWEITIDVAPPGGTVQAVLFTFCVIG